MPPTLYLPLAALALLAGMLLFTRLGERAGQACRARLGDSGFQGIGSVDGALYALFGLMIAFTFSGAYARFEARRDLIVVEANAIGTAWLRIDILPSDAQPEIRAAFREYLDSRLAIQSLLPDVDAVEAELAHSARVQEKLWRLGVAATGDSSPARMLFLPALNEAIDVTTSRLAAWKTHVPWPVVSSLIALALACAWCAGFNQAKSEHPSRRHTVLFAVVTTAVIYLTFDIEFPSVGLVNLEDTNELLVDLRRTMG